MSISEEEARKYHDAPAIVCCRTTAGTKITAADLEDPAIFDELAESGLIQITPETISVGEALGATLTRDVDGLTALTAALVGKAGVGGASGVAAGAGGHANSGVNAGVGVNASGGGNASGGVNAGAVNGVIHIRAAEIRGLDLTLPAGAFPALAVVNAAAERAAAAAAEPAVTERVVGTLVKRAFAVTDVALGDATGFDGGKLTIRRDICAGANARTPLVKKIALDIIYPDKRHVYSDTIMDVIPIAAKVEGIVGTGVTHILDGVVVILTGVDENGVQAHEFGSCEGFVDENIVYGRPGCPDPGDIMIRVSVTLQANTGMERRGPYAAHTACDVIIQEIREALKKRPASEAAREETLKQYKKTGRPRVLLVKEIMGQGAMHDNVMLPAEPAGVPGGRNNVDLGNVPVALTVNEVRDGGIHALTCIGPASKEDTRHYFREPVLEALAADPELDLVGVVFVGSPQVNDEKAFVAKRLGALAGAMSLDGAVVTTEGFGNNHIDFSYHIEEIGRLGVPVVGVTYAAYQGQLVVGNKYMDAMIECNKDASGLESERLGENTITPEDARRAVLMLKNKIAGVPILPAKKAWDQAVIDANQRVADGAAK